MSFNGGPTAATLSDGADSISGDGTDDHGLITLPNSLEGSSLQSFSIEFAIEHSTSSQSAAVYGARNSDVNQFLSCNLNLDVNANADVGNIRFNLTDDAGDRVTFAPSASPNLDDGTRHNVSVIYNDTSTNDVDVIIDGSSVALSFANQQSPSNFAAWDVDMAVWARNLGGSLSFYSDMEIGAMRWHDSAISSQTIGDYA